MKNRILHHSSLMASIQDNLAEAVPECQTIPAFTTEWDKGGGIGQWCKQDQILKTKTKITRTRPRPLLTRPRSRPKVTRPRKPEVNKGTWRI